MTTPGYTQEELNNLKNAAALLERYKFIQIFGDIAGALQKVINVIEINLGIAGDDKYDIVFPERLPHIKGSEFLAVIIRAIKEEKVLRIYYQPFYEDKPYFAEIHPYLLKEYRNRWYVLGLHDFKNELRTYSLDRIRDVQTSDIAYKKKAFDANEYFRKSIGVISPPGEPPRITIAVQKTQAQYLITQPWHESQNIEEENGNNIVFSYRIHPTYEFISLLLSYGKDLKVISPSSLRQTMRSELETMLGYYSS
ncbi:MAG: WYL domain-containing protein [Bacteroidales bacterium]|nr:WYL domain-containing protein [Bacteroidales bacterium]